MHLSNTAEKIKGGFFTPNLDPISLPIYFISLQTAWFSLSASSSSPQSHCAPGSQSTVGQTNFSASPPTRAICLRVADCVCCPSAPSQSKALLTLPSPWVFPCSWCRFPPGPSQLPGPWPATACTPGHLMSLHPQNLLPPLISFNLYLLSRNTHQETVTMDRKGTKFGPLLWFCLGQS